MMTVVLLRLFLILRFATIWVSDIVKIATSHMEVVDHFVDFVGSLAFEHFLVHHQFATAALVLLTIIIVIRLIVDLNLIIIFDAEASMLIGWNRIGEWICSGTEQEVGSLVCSWLFAASVADINNWIQFWSKDRGSLLVVIPLEVSCAHAGSLNLRVCIFITRPWVALLVNLGWRATKLLIGPRRGSRSWLSDNQDLLVTLTVLVQGHHVSPIIHVDLSCTFHLMQVAFLFSFLLLLTMLVSFFPVTRT